MSKKLSNPVYYDEYRYKSYLWREDGRHALPSRKKTGRQRRDVRPDRPCKKDKKSRIDREAFFVTVTILLCFSLTFVLAELSGRGTLMNLIAEKKKTATGYYAVAADRFETESLAPIGADEIKELGGAGYVLYDKKYYLLVSAYANREDAEKVCRRMSGYNGCIYEITIKTPYLGWCDKTKREKVKNVLTYADKVFASLYGVSADYETGAITKRDANNKIAALQKEIKTLTGELDEISNNANRKEYIRIKTELIATDAMLKNILSSEATGNLYNAAIRFTYLAVITGYKNLVPTF